jgi:hypothetical protein
VPKKCRCVINRHLKNRWYENTGKHVFQKKTKETIKYFISVQVAGYVKTGTRQVNNFWSNVENEFYCCLLILQDS